MIIYVVDPIKRTTRKEKRKGRASGTKDDFQRREKVKRTSEEDDRVEDKNEISVDSVICAARLGASIRGAAYRVSTRKSEVKKGHGLTE